MVNREDIEQLKTLLVNLDIDYNEWTSDYDEDIDYEDLKKRIYDTQREIKSIVECWEE